MAAKGENAPGAADHSRPADRYSADFVADMSLCPEAGSLCSVSQSLHAFADLLIALLHLLWRNIWE
jgi:hypothetical protein